DPLPAAASGWWRLWKTAGIALLAAGLALLVGALAGSRDPLRPLAGLASRGAPAAAPLPWMQVASLGELEERLRAGGKPAMLDFYADWCVSGKEMEAYTFSEPRLRAKPKGVIRLPADATSGREDDPPPPRRPPL